MIKGSIAKAPVEKPSARAARWAWAAEERAADLETKKRRAYVLEQRGGLVVLDKPRPVSVFRWW